MTESSPRILVVDDDSQIRRALRRALEARGYAVELAATGEEALDVAAGHIPDMVILDLSLPGMSGLDVCRELRTWTQAPILVLSIHETSSDKVAALDMGADDYLTKPFDTGELLARIRSHLRRSAQVEVTDPILEIDGLRMDLGGRQVFSDGEEVRLTRTEFEILQCLVRNAGRVVTCGLLLRHVWGPEFEGDVHTLRVHVANLRRKIEPAPDQPARIVTEPGVGYRLRPSPASG